MTDEQSAQLEYIYNKVQEKFDSSPIDYYIYGFNYSGYNTLATIMSIEEGESSNTYGGSWTLYRGHITLRNAGYSSGYRIFLKSSTNASAIINPLSGSSTTLNMTPNTEYSLATYGAVNGEIYITLTE